MSKGAFDNLFIMELNSLELLYMGNRTKTWGEGGFLNYMETEQIRQ